MDKNKLMYEMAKQKVSILDMCHKLNMSRSAFYRKCNGISEFTQGEIQKIVDILNLDSPVGIFFAEKCLKRHYVQSVKSEGVRGCTFTKPLRQPRRTNRGSRGMRGYQTGMVGEWMSLFG